MAKALPGGLIPRLVSASVMSCMVLLSACGGGTSIQHDSTVLPDPALEIAAGPGVPFPAMPDAQRLASAIPGSLGCAGSDFRPDLAVHNVTADGSVAIYSPQAGGGAAAMAYAIYEFDLSLLPDPHAPFGIELVPDGPVDEPVGMYIGLGDPATKRWYWVEPELATDGRGILRWSWGMSDGSSAVRSESYLPVAVMVSGAEMRLASIAIRPADALPAGGTLAFRKGWDGTVKCPCAVELERDSLGVLNATYYDDTNGQMYHMWQEGRSWFSQALSCFGDNGSSHDLINSPDGGLMLAYYETDSATGGMLTMPMDALQQKQWSPANFRFETGDDGSGAFIEAGANPSVVFDDDGFPHVFYECASTGRIRHAWLELGAIDWLHEYVSPDGSVEGQPIGLNSSHGIVCLTRKGWDGCIYRPSEGTWTAAPITGNMHNPLDPESNQAFFDAVCRDSTVVMAMACTSGQRLVRYDLDTEEVVQDVIYNDDPASGCFIDLVVMGDGSVRIAQYNAADRMIYFETGDIPGDEQFTSLPAVQYGEDEDCDGIAFWVDDAPASGSPRDAFLVELSSAPLGIKPPDDGKITRKKEFKGHVTLLK